MGGSSIAQMNHNEKKAFLVKTSSLKDVRSFCREVFEKLEIDQNLKDVLYKFVFNFVKSTLQKEIKNFDLKSSWAVCQFESDYNPIHWHDGHLSGVMYTKMPKDLGSSYKDQNKNEKSHLYMDRHNF